MQKIIKCPLCKGTLEEGFTELVFRHERSVVVLEGVPALVCSHCGEASVDSDTAQKSYDKAQEEFKRGVVLEFSKYAA